jgi:hypothetical protein
LAPGGLGLGWLLRRIFRLAFLCCFFQVISYPLPLEEDTAKSRFLLHVPQTISLRDVAIGVKWGKKSRGETRPARLWPIPGRVAQQGSGGKRFDIWNGS